MKIAITAADEIVEPVPAGELTPEPGTASACFSTEQIRTRPPPSGPFTWAHFVKFVLRSTAARRHRSRVFFDMP